MEIRPDVNDRTRTRLIVGIAVIGAVVLLLTAAFVTLVLLPDDADGPTTGPVSGPVSGPRALREPLRLQQVVETGPPPCAQGMIAQADGSTCYRLGANTITVRQVAEMRSLPPDPKTGASGWTISVRLTPPDAAAFADLTRRAASEAEGTPARQIAIIAGTEILSAPSVVERITTGEFWITGDFTRDDTDRLIRRFTGS